MHSVNSRPAAPVAEVPPPPAAAGLRVVMDPASGEVVGQPTADDLGRLGPARRGPRRRAGELERFELPGGARGVVLDGWADHALRVERAADGSLRLVCSRGDRHEGSR